MLDKIITLLKANKEISGWKLYEKRTESAELFFIKKSLDMNRSKDVSHLTLTVYVDFEEDGKTYRGSSASEIHPTMTEVEISRTIERLAFAASLVKNEYYPLATPKDIQPSEVVSNLGDKPLAQWIPDIIKAVYKNDIYDKGGINSAELFLNKTFTRIINSEGVDVSFPGFSGTLEFITTWKETDEEIELYRNIDFASFDAELISQEVKDMIDRCRYKAAAKPTPVLKDIPVLLTGTPVKEFFTYYYDQANSNAVYNEISTLKAGEAVQGDSVGDLVTISLDPCIGCSIFSAPYDEDGFPLLKTELYNKGILKGYWGNVRYSHYLKTEPTGDIKNFIVEGGNKSSAELKQGAYLELLAFSDFQMDTFTGDFGGEIRLGYYNDGNTIIPVTGGSLSGNIKNIQAKMYFSKELQYENNFVGPKTILLRDVSIAGCE